MKKLCVVLFVLNFFMHFFSGFLVGLKESKYICGVIVQYDTIIVLINYQSDDQYSKPYLRLQWLKTKCI